MIVAIVQGTSPNFTDIKTNNGYFNGDKEYAKELKRSMSQKFKGKGFKTFLESRDREDSINKLKGKKAVEQNEYIRAAFYDPQWNYAASLSDLEAYAPQLNTIFPPWFSINIKDNSKIESRIDAAGLAIMKKNNLRILPIFSNYNSSKKSGGDFDGALLHVMLNDSAKRNRFIDNLADTILKYDLQGINIDFEEINETSNEPLNGFQKRLYEVFHAKGLMVTRDVVPMNEDYDFEELNKYNDHIILMAYDQYSDGQSGPGPVSAQKWIEAALDDAAKKIDNKKIIVGLAGYGRDWSVDKNGKVLKDDDGKLIEPEAITYSQALDIAKLANSTVNFDNDNFNLHYDYTKEEEGKLVSAPIGLCI